jgi:peptidoglycan/xylan/chitin deacetylase (PgdA/CDA1 family)
MRRISPSLVFSAVVALQPCLLSAGRAWTQDNKPGRFVYDHGAIIRGDAAKKEIALVFTGHEFADGGTFIRDALRKKETRAGFFFTGDFYRNPANASLIKGLREDGHYLGPHSDKHLLYCPWENRDELLVTKEEFTRDILRNYDAMADLDIAKEEAPYFIPPYEWYNETIVGWAKELGLVLFNFTPGTLSNADYTTPDLANYRSSARIYQSIIDFEKSDPRGLNGFILLLHIGTHPGRTDKFYRRLEGLLTELRGDSYRFVRVDELMGKRE